MFGGGNSFTPELQRYLGKYQLHQFFGGFAAKNITSTAQLKKMSKEEIMKIGETMNMPVPAMDRLLEVLKKVPKKKETVSTPASQDEKPKIGGGPRPPTNHERKSDQKTDDSQDDSQDGGKSKTEASTYYHFKSTDKDMAAKFDAKKVEEGQSVEWKTAKGASAWNPGNTFEDRSFTTFANNRWKEMMTKWGWPGTDLRIKSFSKTNMEYSIIINRGKIKFIYDMSFTCQWVGKIDGTKVKGKLSVSDVMSDSTDDEWEFDVVSEERNTATMTAAHKRRNAALNTARALIESGKQIIFDKLHELLKELKAKGPKK